MPRFPPPGPDGHGSPASTVLSRHYDSRFRFPWAYCFAVRYRVLPRGSCCRSRAPVADAGLPQAGVLIVDAGGSPSSDFYTRTKPGLPGSLVIHPVTLRRSSPPVGPVRLAHIGVPGAAPAIPDTKTPTLYISRAIGRFTTHCVRFTSCVTARYATLVSGWQAEPLPDGSRTHWTTTKGFRSCYPPSQGFGLAQGYSYPICSKML